MNKTLLKPEIAKLCQSLTQGFSKIPAARQEKLLALADYIRQKIKAQERPQLIVICTHNSRRSHLGQLWLAVGADYYQLPPLQTYSGGTEATAFNHRAVSALQDIGFSISTKNATSKNPVYEVKWANEMPSLQMFSKKYDAAPNPREKFGAIMVCTQADEACPIISGAEFRLSLPYEDPKDYDDTDLEAQKYKERCRQIGQEILFAISQIQN